MSGKVYGRKLSRGQVDLFVCYWCTAHLHLHRLAHRAFDGSPICALAGLAGALSMVAHAGGKSLSFKPLADPEFSGIFKRRIQSANQDVSDLSQPSPDGTAG